MQSSEQDLLSQIRIYKSKVTVSQHELQNYIKYLDQVVFKKIFFFCSPNKVSLTPSFERAFGSLNDMEKADYYLSTLKIIYELSSSEEFLQEKKQEAEKFEVIFRRQNQNKLWKKTVIILHYDTIVMDLQALNAKLNLMNYIIRKSKSKNKNAFVLESTRAECDPITLRIAHTNQSQMNSLLLKMKVLMRLGLRKKIARMMRLVFKNRDITDNWFERKEIMSMKLPNDIPLQKKTIREILRSKTTDMTQIQKSKNQSMPIFVTDQQIIKQLDSFEEYEEMQSGYFIHKTKSRIRKVEYYNAITISLSDFDYILFNHETFKYWKSSLYSISLIGDVPKLSTKFFHEINIYKDCKEVDFVYTRHRFEREGMIYFIDRSEVTAEYGSYENNKKRGKIEYGLWRVRHKSKEVIELIVEIEVSHLPCSDIYKAMSEQIGQLEKIPSAKAKTKTKSKNSNQNIDFFSVDEKNLSVSEAVLNQLQSYEGAYKYGRDSSDLQRINESSEFFSIRNSDMGLQAEVWSSKGTMQDESRKKVVNSFRYQLQPQKQQYRLVKEFKNGCFFDAEECVVNQKGDLLFTNQQKIAAQGNVIKTVVKKIGANFFSGKSILNVSLPIQIFATDTNLQRLCRSMAYAPHFLENKDKLSPLERMKAAICFAVGNLLLYIEMAKPFNPILGETYQAFIDGCPVYGEQISHHPPISSLLLIGRGYKVSANIEAKVDLGLNSASGLNDGNYHITFGNETSSKSGIIFNSPPGQLSGVIYGDRKLNIIKKSRFLDVQNRLFCELSWGKSRGGDKVGRFHDYVEGKIVELWHKPSSNIQKIKQSEKDLVLGHVTGRWTEFIYFNGEPIFQINKLQPFRVMEQQKKLLSDSFFREDRLMLQQQRYKDAQNEKQRLQELQRRDRKLRKQYKS